MTSIYDNSAVIEVTRRMMPYGGEEKDYRWVGPKGARTCINTAYFQTSEIECVKGHNRIRVGPFALRLVEENLLFGGIYVREDAGYWNFLCYAIPARWEHWSRRVLMRFVLTLHIWRLADVAPYEIPGVKHIRAVQWLQRQHKRSQGAFHREHPTTPKGD